MRTRLTQPPREAALPHQRRSHVFQWVIKDQKGFQELVWDLRELIDDLKSVTDFRGILERQRYITTVAAESISDRESIQLLQEAALDEDEAISDAASVRAISLHVDGASTLNTYYTAPESQSRPYTGEEQSDDTLDTYQQGTGLPQNQRIMSLYQQSTSQSNITRAATDLSPAALDRLNERHTINISAQPLETEEIGPLVPWRRLKREFQRISETRTANIVTFAPIPGSQFQRLIGTFVGPKETAFEDGIFHVFFLILLEYPFKPPIARCMTRVYHPNIDAQGRICVNVLADSWSPVLKIESTLRSISALLALPAPDDPLVPEIASTLIRDPELYNENARLYTQRYANQVSPIEEQIQRAISSAEEAKRRRGDGEWVY